MSISFIQTQDELVSFCQQLAHSKWLALDTEFLREKTYYAQLCLLQISNGEILACIDTLAVDDLTPLLDIIYDANIIKVLHSAFQDLEILFNLRQSTPKPVFDTQIAAAMLGQGYQISYAALVKELLDVELDKSHSRTDWSRRPLSDAQLEYAANDVLFLGDIYLKLRDSLMDCGRLDWLEEDDSLLTDEKQYVIDFDNIWLRVKGKERLNHQQLAVLRALASWREQRAIKIDRPRRWVMKDDVLVALAQLQGDSLPDDLELSDKFIHQYGEELVSLIQQAARLPESEWPEFNIRPRPDKTEKHIIKTLSQFVDKTAAELNMESAILTTRRELAALYHGTRKLPVLHGWRATVIGNSLLALLEELQQAIAEQ